MILGWAAKRNQEIKMDKVVMVRNSLEEDVIHQWVSAHNSVSENYSFPKINGEESGQ